MIPTVLWLPSPYYNARDYRYPLRAIVSHRIVGSLPSARAAFGVAPGSSRNASSHFGIGYVNGALTIDQYVDLDHMAWTNGDVRDPTWPRIIPGVNPNLYSVTIEHEDGGSTNGGKVSDEVWQASMELQKLLVSGDAARIRAQGVRAGDTIIRQLAAIPRDETGFIDHHQIAGPNKPYCFRRWLEDPGFVEGDPSRRTRLLNFLEDDVSLANMSPLFGSTATLAAGATARRAPAFDRNDYDAGKLFSLASPSSGPALGWVQGTNLTLADGTVFDARTRWLATWNKDHGVVFWHERDVTAIKPPAETDAAARLKVAEDTIVTLKTKIAAAVAALK